MSDQLIMENYLLLLKSTMEVYVHGTLESSNKIIKDTLKCGLDETVKHQGRTYDIMAEYGWYKVQNVEPKEIKNTIKKIEQSAS